MSWLAVILFGLNAWGQLREPFTPSRLHEDINLRLGREVVRSEPAQRLAVVLQRFRLAAPAASFTHTPMVGA